MKLNLQEKLIQTNRKLLEKDAAVVAQQEALDRETEKLVQRQLDQATETVEAEKTALMETLGFDFKLAEAEKVKKQQAAWAHLPQERIFTEDAIKKLCLTYNLRFLPTKYYKGQLDAGIPEKVEEFKKLNGGLPTSPKTINDFAAFLLQNSFPPSRPQAGEFCIAAPAESFNLTPRPVDPLLFIKLDWNRWYLIHKWGEDVSVFRAVKQFFARSKELNSDDGDIFWCIPLSLIMGGLGVVAFQQGPAILGWILMGSAGLVLAAMIAICIIAACSKQSTTPHNWNSPFSNE